MFGAFPQGPWEDSSVTLQSVIVNMLSMENEDNCTSAQLPASLQLRHLVFNESSFCVLAETNHSTGFGVFAVRLGSPDIKRNIHLSVPHPITDPATIRQVGIFTVCVCARV